MEAEDARVSSYCPTRKSLPCYVTCSARPFLTSPCSPRCLPLSGFFGGQWADSPKLFTIVTVMGSWSEPCIFSFVSSYCYCSAVARLLCDPRCKHYIFLGDNTLQGGRMSTAFTFETWLQKYHSWKINLVSLLSTGFWLSLFLPFPLSFLPPPSSPTAIYLLASYKDEECCFRDWV